MKIRRTIPFALGVGLASLFLCSGCIIDTVPMPDDTPSPQAPGDPFINKSLVFWADDGSGATLVAGVSFSVGGSKDTNVELALPGSASPSCVATISQKGSFVCNVAGVATGDQIEIRYGGITELLTLLAPSANAEDEARQPPVAGAGDFLSSGTNGEVTLTLGPGSVTPGLTVVVVNVTQGFAVSALAAADGSVTVTIAANAGDTIEVFFAEEAINNGAARTQTVTL